ncbi:hypothetical protein [Halomarina pelagica]|nr:hypothetical protein [Halomarina sp. BND7]
MGGVEIAISGSCAVVYGAVVTLYPPLRSLLLGYVSNLVPRPAA